MKITKEELKEIAEKNGLNEKVLEEFLVTNGKKVGNSLIDVLKLASDKTENKWDDMIVDAGEEKMRNIVNSLEINL